ncbi:kelch repeat domain containing protein, putative [Babesia ovis]|uniref:tRNA(Phe) 7-[(3-amino-3-carboxypropyl)-4-demethylwyosine(37)-N(4)]-methyltransferase n=1 Tax=Babesia ovis TaxID=5869 RepID=A0A9W5WVI7_BABOV|nr:kelch repeat domain containing protein, putative [Babesia ovis]
MRVDPEKVAKVLGDELLELIYTGTEDSAKESCADTRRRVQNALGELESQDGASWQIYSNIAHLMDQFRNKRQDSRTALIQQLRDRDINALKLDGTTRDYINGKGSADHGSQPDEVDRSVKGSVDVLLIPLLRAFLRTGRFASTSCCSGRTVLFESNADHASAATKRSTDFGRAGRFLYASHSHMDVGESEHAVRALNSKVHSKGVCYHNVESNETRGAVNASREMTIGETQLCDVVLKFESFLIHVECNSLEDSAELLQLARECGLKQSGIITCSKRFIVSIRGSYGLEAPVAIRHYSKVSRKYDVERYREASNDLFSQSQQNTAEDVQNKEYVNTTWLVTEDYFRYILATCNQKLASSIRQMLRFYWAFVNRFDVDASMPFVLPRNRATSDTKVIPRCVEQRSQSQNTVVALKSLHYIKVLKTMLENKGLYDKSRRVITVPSRGQTNKDVDYSLVSVTITEHERHMILTTDTIQNMNVAAFIPISCTTDDVLKETLVGTPEILEDMVITNGSLRYLLYCDT